MVTSPSLDAGEGGSLLPRDSLFPAWHRFPQQPGPRPGDTLGATLGRLEVRLATCPEDVRRAQRLRFDVFHAAETAMGTARDPGGQLDSDRFDEVCDHLLVVDLGAGGADRPPVVATARLLRQDRAHRSGFYSAGEFDLAPMLASHPDRSFVELGRSCVREDYRTGRTIELLWHGIWAYTRRHGGDVLFGCASFPGTDPARLAAPLSFLHHHALAPAEWRVRARPSLSVPMDRLRAAAVDRRRAVASLPPLLKAYLRLGAGIGDGAVVDPEFGTTDVFVVLPIERIGPRYLGHFGPRGAGLRM